MSSPVAPLLHLAKGTRAVVVAGSFAPNGSEALAADATKGAGYTVARTSPGLYTITLSDSALSTYEVGLDDPGLSLISFTATPQLTTAASVVLQAGVWDADAKTLQIRAIAPGAAVPTTKTITLPALASITDATLITATDGANTVIFGLDVAGDGIVAGADAAGIIDLSSAETDVEVAALVYAALAASTLTGWTFTDEEDGTITAVHKTPGTAGNTAWTVVTDADVTVVNTVTGSDAVQLADIPAAAGNRINFQVVLGHNP